MYIQKRMKGRKPVYSVVYRDAHGDQHEEGAFSSKEAAGNLRKRLEKEITAGTWKPPRERKREGKPLTLAAYYEGWIKAKTTELKSSTAVSYEHTFRNHILPALGRMRLDDIRPKDIQAWINKMAAKKMKPKGKEAPKKISPATVRRAYRYLRSCLLHAYKTGETHNNPCLGIILPRVPHEELEYLKPSEISALLEKAPEPERSLFAVLAYSGLRLGEALALRWRDVDLQRAYSIHGGIGEPKTTSSRRAVPLLPILAEILGPQRGKPDELLFCKTRGARDKQPLDPANARKVFERSLEAAELKHVTMHSLRHSFATVMIASGASIKALQRALGHATVSMTLNTYAHLLEENMEGPVLKADALLRGLENGKVVSLEKGRRPK